MKLEAIKKELRHRVKKELTKLESTIKRLYKPVKLELNLDNKKSILNFTCLLNYSQARADKQKKAIMKLLVNFAEKHKLILATNPISDLSGEHKRKLIAYRRAGFMTNQGKNKIAGIRQSVYSKKHTTNSTT